jgi:hypothetical protein
MESQDPYIYPLGTEWPRYNPRHWVPFPSPLTACRATVEVFYPASTRECIVIEVEVNLWPTVSRQACLGAGIPSGSDDHISFISLMMRVFDMGHLLWREDGSVIYLYNCFWALPGQSLLVRSPAKLTAIFYCLIWDPPNLEGQVPVFISPRNRVAQLYPRALGSLFVASYDS